MFVSSSPVLPVSDLEATSEGASSNRSGSSDEIIDIKGDQFENVNSTKQNLTMWDMWALGITTAMGGHYYLWNLCLIAGFGSFIIAVFLIASAYGVLILSMAELSSALPFAGGAYGVTRVTMGSYPGFLVGCFDTYQSIFYVLISVIGMGVMISVLADDVQRKNEPYWWAIIYTSYFLLHAWGGKYMWRAMRIMSMGSLLLLLIYILGSIKYADFNEYAPLPMPGPDKNRWFQGGVDLFLKILPIPTWFFVGTESINLAAHEAENPKRDIPRAYILTYCTVVVTTFATIFAAVSTFPGTLYLPVVFNPQTAVNMLVFDLDIKRATALSLPAIYTAGFGFTYYFSQQVRAMGKSGLAHPWLGYDIPYRHTPVPALLFGCIGGFLLGLRYYYWRPLEHEDVWSISLLGAVSTWISQLISFISFRLYYSTIKREFVSPLGIAGAVYGLCVFLLVFICIGGLEAEFGIIAFSVYIGILTVYYMLVVKWRQVFSEEEKTVLFKAYLMKTNRQKAERIRTGGAAAHAHHPHTILGAAFGGSLPGVPMVPMAVRYKPSPTHADRRPRAASAGSFSSSQHSISTTVLYGTAQAGAAAASSYSACHTSATALTDTSTTVSITNAITNAITAATVAAAAAAVTTTESAGAEATVPGNRAPTMDDEAAAATQEIRSPGEGQLTGGSSADQQQEQQELGRAPPHHQPGNLCQS